MLTLLAALPYVAAIALYWLTTGDAVGDAEGEAPSNWKWRFVGPVMVGGLTPLALAATNGISGASRTLLLLTTAMAILFTVLIMAAVKESHFFRLLRPLSIGAVNFSRFPRWRIIVVVGTAVLCYGAVVNVIVAGNTESKSEDVSHGSSVRLRSGR